MNEKPNPDMEQDFKGWNGDNGAGDRPPLDNGTHNASFSVGGVATVSKVDYPLPKDVNAGLYDAADTPTNPEAADEISDYGINERKEVGYNGSIANYGFDTTAGGSTNKNTKD